jgi:site-specific recombinase XerC
MAGHCRKCVKAAVERGAWSVRLPTWLTASERKRLWELDLSTRDRAILAIFIFGGLRSNELRRLDVRDIDFDERTILVRFGKRNKQRLIPIHANVDTALREHLQGAGGDGPIFRGNRETRISNRGLRFLVAGWGRQADLRKELHPHSLRHTFAVSLLEADVDLETIRDLLGHASIATTSIYLHCTTQRKRLAVDRL